MDVVLRVYRGYADEVKETHLRRFTKSDPVISRVDTLMVETMTDKKSYAQLWWTVKLVLSHREATVERGLWSNNKQI